MKTVLGAHLPKLVFVLAFLPGLAMTVLLHTGAERRLAAEFDRVANQAIDRIVTRLHQHVVVLRAARGLMAATRGGISREDFVRFLSSVDIVGDLSGVQGIGFARMVATRDGPLAQADVLRHYGTKVAIRPETDQPWRTPIVLLEPANERNLAALGFDMYADPGRRSAMDHATASDAAQMTGPVELVQEITAEKQTGFLIYLPFKDAAQAGPDAPPVDGFVYAPFRGGDLIHAALAEGSDLPVVLRVVDAGTPGRPLFDGSAGADPSRHRSSSQEILGRQWIFDVWADGSGPGRVRYVGSALVGLIALLFAAAAAYATAARQHEAAQARALAAAAAREADYRELLLQEMKHRIKNHIARIQSIARQSARGATDVKAFTAAFDARLQAMSAVQEILAGTAAAQADIRAILVKELQQSVDATEVEDLVDGPAVRLDERQAHAFALVAHELVTNAMKYGGLSAQGASLHVSWTVEPGADGLPWLNLDWAERIPGLAPLEDRASGFGSRLIEASLKGELSGALTRSFGPGSLEIRIRFPLDRGLNPSRTG
jgi:CHASE1-domain containing sensor protein/two-component sensor histidine kinase